MGKMNEEAQAKARKNQTEMDRAKRALQQNKEAQTAGISAPSITYAEIAEKINTAKTYDDVNDAESLIVNLPEDQKNELKARAENKRLALDNAVQAEYEQPELTPEPEVSADAPVSSVPTEAESVQESPKKQEMVVPVITDRTGKTKVLKPTSTSFFVEVNAFETAQRIAKSLCASTLVPKDYQGNENISNCMIALEMAQRMNTSPLMVMQNLYVVHGRPGWSAQYVIASINKTGKYSPLRFKLSERDNFETEVEYTEYEWSATDRRKVPIKKKIKVFNRTCFAWANELDTGEVLEGPEVSVVMAASEGWLQKDGSKWKTMEDVMLRYRAASFFGKLYAPEIMMGMQTAEELSDIIETDNVNGVYQNADTDIDKLNDSLLGAKTA